jgi:hypothetical protein
MPAKSKPAEPVYEDLGTVESAIACPSCGESIPTEVVLDPHDPQRVKLIARHACKGMAVRTVYEKLLPEGTQPPADPKES